MYTQCVCHTENAYIEYKGITKEKKIQNMKQGDRGERERERERETDRQTDRQTDSE